MAAKTKFALGKLEIPVSDSKFFTLWLDGNGKVTVGNGDFEHPVPNSFSLVQVQDCPFATHTCKSVCYVHKLEKAEEEVHEKYRLNSVTIRRILEKPSYMFWAERTLADWIRANCSKGFRWHVSGDIFSPRYAMFIKKVSLLSAPVLNWLYTRSFPYVRTLVGVPNLVVNLSTDRDNYKDALELHKKFKLRLCYLTVDGEVPKDLPEGSVIFPSHELRGRDLNRPTDAWWWRTLSKEQKRMVCPPDFFGQSEKFRCGPCKKCLV